MDGEGRLGRDAGLAMSRPPPRRSSPIAVVCVGNTHTRGALLYGERVTRLRVARTATLGPSQARRWLAEFRLAGAAGLAFASVVPAGSRLWRAALRRGWTGPVRIIRWNRVPGLRFEYPQPRTLGADRLASLAAVVGPRDRPTLIIDAGTATTFNAVDRNGTFLGGAIAPGLAAMLDALACRTALLPRLPPGPPGRAPAKSTGASMRLGVALGWQAMVREVTQAILTHPRMRGATVIATGGGAREVRRALGKAVVQPHLALVGLARWYQAVTAAPARRRAAGSTRARRAAG